MRQEDPAAGRVRYPGEDAATARQPALNPGAGLRAWKFDTSVFRWKRSFAAHAIRKENYA